MSHGLRPPLLIVARLVRRCVAPVRWRWPMVSRAVATAMRAEGMISAREADLLVRLAANAPKGCIVEIGAYRGRSTIALALGAGRALTPRDVFSLDPHVPFQGERGGRFGPRDRTAYLQNVLGAGVSRVVRPVSLPSSVVGPGWSEPVGLLFIDGDHSYDGVRRDVQAFEEHLVPGAVIAFDDSLEPGSGPARVVTELLARGGYSRGEAVGKIATVVRKETP